MKGFVALPRRWVVERSSSWFGRNRRLAKDFDNLAKTFVTLASIQFALRRLARVLRVCRAADSHDHGQPQGGSRSVWRAPSGGG